jgi:hypothetical protein
VTTTLRVICSAAASALLFAGACADSKSNDAPAQDGSHLGAETSYATGEIGSRCSDDNECLPGFCLAVFPRGGVCMTNCNELDPPCPQGTECTGVEVDGGVFAFGEACVRTCGPGNESPCTDRGSTCVNGRCQ